MNFTVGGLKVLHRKKSVISYIKRQQALNDCCQSGRKFWVKVFIQATESFLYCFLHPFEWCL